MFLASSSLSRTVLAGTKRRILEDAVKLVEIYREVDGGEEFVASVQGRIAPADRAVVGRDVNTLPGRVSPSYKVLSVPLGTDVKKNDLAWAGAQMYRVVSVETFLHELQLMLAMKQ